MKGIFIFLFFFFACFAQELKSHYIVENNEIFSTDLFPKAPRFFIAQMGDKFSLQIQAKDLIELFKKNHYPLQSNQISKVVFEYRLPFSAKKVEQKIKNFFLQAYASYDFQIQSIALKPIAKISDIEILDAKLTPAMLKKKNFILTLEVKDKKTSLVSLAPFLCEIRGNLMAYIATREIKTGEEFDENNTQRQRIAFEGISSELIKQHDWLNSSARAFIPKDQVILKSKIKPKILVKRGEMVDVIYQENHILIEGRLEAMQNGSLDEEILARNPESKKIIKIKITAKGKGKIL